MKNSRPASKFGGILAVLGWGMIVPGIACALFSAYLYLTEGAVPIAMPISGLSSVVWGILFCGVSEALENVAKLARSREL